MGTEAESVIKHRGPENMEKNSKCPCANCGVHVEFDASPLAPEEVRKGPCPSCGAEMWFFDNSIADVQQTGAETANAPINARNWHYLFPTLNKLSKATVHIREIIGERIRKRHLLEVKTLSSNPQPATTSSGIDQSKLFLWWPNSTLGSLLMAVFAAYIGLIFYRSLILLLVFVHGGSFPNPADFLMLLLMGFLLLAVYTTVIFLRNINVVAPYKRKLERLHPDIECENSSFRDCISANSRVVFKTCIVLLVMAVICCFRDGRTLTICFANIAETRDNINRLRENARVCQQQVADKVEETRNATEKLNLEERNQSMIADSYNGNPPQRNAASPQFFGADPTEANNASQQAAAIKAQSDTLQMGIDKLKAAAQQANDEANSKIESLMKDNCDSFFMYRSYQIVSTTELVIVVFLTLACIRLWKKLKNIQT